MRKSSQISRRSIRNKTNSFFQQNKASSFFPPVNQPKFHINPPNDLFEKEADAMAGKVMNTTATSSSYAPQSNTGILHRASDNAFIIHLSQALQQTLQSSGEPMDHSTSSFMEQRFGCNFKDVQIHHDPVANQSSADINALAYTHENHVVFGEGQYQPNTFEGKKLLSHELAHVVQQGSINKSNSIIQRTIPRSSDDPRPLTPIEVAAAKKVFGTALKTEDITISEGGMMSLGGYARTVYNRIYFPGNSFNKSDFIPWLIHELTHVWQYQRGADLPGMLYEAMVGIYDYGGEAGLKIAWEEGKALDEFTTEQQGDILENYYKTLISGGDVTVYQGFIDQVKTGHEKEHRYKTIEPLPHATFDLAKANEDYRVKLETEMITLLKKPMKHDDADAALRATKLVELFKKLTWWYGTYTDRIIQHRSGDELVQLLFSKLSYATRVKIFKVIHLEQKYWK